MNPSETDPKDGSSNRQNASIRSLGRSRNRKLRSINDDEGEMRLAPSQLLSSLSASPGSKRSKLRRASNPKIIEFQNLEDHSSQKTSTVPIGDPIFQPQPSEITFDEYKPFGVHHAKLSMRNNDCVARRIRIEPPDSPYFQVSAPRPVSRKQTLVDGKVAAGMEICFIVTFKPQETREYGIDLVCCTEREKFLVPIRTKGTYAILSFPDEIQFGSCPVKADLPKVLTVRNIGTRDAHFLLQTCANDSTSQGPESDVSDVFKVKNKSLRVAKGESVQIELIFSPKTVKAYDGELMVEDDKGQVSYVKLYGQAQNINLYLGQPIVEPDPAYISLASQKTVKIYNCSDYPVKFSWKAFADAEGEIRERERLHAQLDRMEEVEVGKIHQMEYSAKSTDSDNDSSDEDSNMPLALRDALSLMHRKYQNLHKAVDEDPMEFADECFLLTPTKGEIWANSEIELAVTFKPKMAASYACVAFLDVVGRSERLPLQLHGQGIGPKASLSYDVLDIGDVFINSVHKYQLVLQNKGDIPAEYSLIESSSLFSKNFQFAPPSGILAVNQSHTINVTFFSNVLHDFSEHFHFQLKGSDEPLGVHFKGHVIGPTFHFDVVKLDFGVISYNFLQSKELTLVNTSGIPMKYLLRVPQDGKYQHKEFDIIPNTGTILPHGREKILLKFTSVNVKEYEYFLTVEVEGVGEDLLSIPIFADSRVPPVSIKNTKLSYGDCYLRYSYYQEVVLVNQSPKLSACYEIVEQDEHSRVIAEYSSEEPRGEIAPEGKTVLRISLNCEKLGGIRLPLYIRIPGSTDLPLMATLIANGIGPEITISDTSLNWGNCSCLVDHVRTLKVHNKSFIPATFRTFIKNARSKFSVNVKEGTLKPEETMNIKLTANLDDTIVFKDQFHILIGEGSNILIPLTARGTGTTMWSEKNMKLIDFEYQLTNRECTWMFTLENKGRRSQVLSWTNTTAKMKALEEYNKILKQNAKKDRNKSVSRKVDPGLVDTLLAPTFTIHPASIELKPRTACNFTFRGISSVGVPISEVLVCETRVGQEKQPKIAFSTEIRAVFITPMLTASPASLSFSYTYSQDSDIAQQCQPLTLTNTSQLQLSFVLRTQVPFSLDSWEHTLDPSESIVVNVEFYPGYKDDRLSRVINGKLVVAFRDHPHRDNFELIGDISFPNLAFEYSKVDFGCILNDTTKSLVVNVTNNSKVSTAFQWAFLEEEDEPAPSSITTASRGTSNAPGASGRKPHIPINQVFDILPIRGYLNPGESEQVEFIYYGHSNRKFKAAVVCEVEGGPEYELTLLGEASSVAFRLDKQFLDFGPVLYDKVDERELCISNTGKVTFSFSISLEKVSRSGVIDVSPSSGKIFANDRQKITVKFRPGVPDSMVEVLILEIAHFPPSEFKVYGRGIFASLTCDISRDTSAIVGGIVASKMPNWFDLIRQAKKSLENPRLDVVPPSTSSEVYGSLGGGMTRPNSRIASAQRNSTGITTSRFSGYTSRITQTSRVSVREPIQAEKPILLNSQSGLETPSNSTSEQSDARSRKGSSLNILAGPTSFDTMEVEAEALRILFKTFILEEVKWKKERASMKQEGVQGENLDTKVPADRRGSAVPPLSLKKNGAIVQHSDGSKSPSSASVSNSLKETSTSVLNTDSFVISHYVLDFQNVVLGMHRVRKFKLRNTGKVPLSFQVDKNLSLSMGFTVEPERVIRLPEDEVMEFNVVYQARKNTRLGKHKVDLKFSPKNGPITIVSLRVNVTVPDLVLSSETIDFGPVVMGQSRVMCAQLSNPTPVVAEWIIKKAVGSGKDYNFFDIQPNSGSLPPGAKVNVMVEFTPRDHRNYHIKLPVKITSNSKLKNLTLKGSGAEQNVRFDPSYAELGPVLPDFNPVRRVITMWNDSDHAIEVYSVNKDLQYVFEEKVYRGISGFDANAILRTPLRKPGDPLPESFVKEYEEIQAAERAKDLEFQQQQQQQEQAQEPPAEDILDTNDEKQTTDDTTSVPASPRIEDEGEASPVIDKEELAEDEEGTISVNNEEQDVVEEQNVVRTLREQGKALDYIMFGPPCGGLSFQSELLSKKEGLSVWKIDSTIEEVVEQDSDLGKRTREALGMASLDGENRKETEEENSAPLSSRSDKRAVEEPQEEVQNNDEEPTIALGLTIELLQEIFSWKLDQHEFNNGSILDGVSSIYLPFDDVVKAMANVYSNAVLVHLGMNKFSHLEQLEGAKERLVIEKQVNEQKLLKTMEDEPNVERVPSMIEDVLDEENDEEGGGDTPNDTTEAVEHSEERGSQLYGGDDSSESPDVVVSSEKSRLLEEIREKKVLLESQLDRIEEVISCEEDRIAYFAQETNSIAVLKEWLVYRVQDIPPSDDEELDSDFEVDQDGEVSIFDEQHNLAGSSSPTNKEGAEVSNADDNDSEKQNAETTESDRRELLPCHIIEVPIRIGDKKESIHSSLWTSIERFRRDQFYSNLTIPEPVNYQLIRKPYARPKYVNIASKGFTIEPNVRNSQGDESLENEETSQGGNAPEEHTEGNAVEGDGSDTNLNRHGQMNGESKYRWIIEPRESCEFVLVFSPKTVGTFDCTLSFEIVGSTRTYNLLCHGLCSVPMINSDPRNVFMNRVKHRPEHAILHRKFVMNRNEFEFGPLLIGKDPSLIAHVKELEGLSDETPTEGEQEGSEERAKLNEMAKSALKLNSDVFRITNSGRFSSKVSFSFEKRIIPGDEEQVNEGNEPTEKIEEKAPEKAPSKAAVEKTSGKKTTDKGAEKGGAPSGAIDMDEGSSVFHVEPQEMVIPESETMEIRVWAFPPEPKKYESSLVCRIEHNPHPVIFPLSCVGAKPTIELDGPWNDPSLTTKQSEDDERTSTEHSAEGDGSDGNIMAKIDFDRLLLGRTEEKCMTVKNTCSIPVTWKIECEDLPSNFVVFPMDGTLKAFQEVYVNVEFESVEEGEFAFELNVLYNDAEGGISEAQCVSVPVEAEAYKIDVCSFENEDGTVGDGVLDFGLNRVGIPNDKSFTLRNNGKYDIMFQFQIKRAFMRELFSVTPASGVITPGETSEINVVFLSRDEVSMRDNKDLKCSIMEKVTREVHSEFHVLLHARSVFSKFRLQPLSGLNFGALKYNEDVKIKQFELRNEGEFEFKFRIQKVNNTAEELHRDGNDEPQETKYSPELFTLDTEVSSAAISVGQFKIEPSGGVLDPGTTVPVIIEFQPTKENMYREMLRIEISGRDFGNSNESSTLLYEVVGESCYPGISTADYEGIFEEQKVIRTLNPSESSISPETLSTQTIFAEQEKLFSFGAVVSSSNPKGVVERFRILNPKKVLASVKFAIREASNSDSKDSSNSAVFKVQPESWDIPPHEHRFVNVYFQPTCMKMYKSIFSAVVVDGADPVTNKLKFEVQGEGTMPCVTIEKPVKRDETGALVLDFGRSRVRKGKSLSIVLRNDGIIPATVLFSMTANSNFNFPLRNGSITLARKCCETLAVEFKPHEVHDQKKTECELKLSVLHNQFEDTVIKLYGQGYQDYVTFEDLPEGCDDELIYGDIDLLQIIQLNESEAKEEPSDERGHINDQSGEESAAARHEKLFSLKNHSNEIVRFEWESHTAFLFSPNVGHIPPKGTKMIRGSFVTGTETTEFKKIPVHLTVKQIEYDQGNSEETEAEAGSEQSQEIQAKIAQLKSSADWDDTMTCVYYEQVEQIEEQKESEDDNVPMKKTKPVTVSIPELSFSAKGDVVSRLPLRCSAIADISSYECKVDTISFKKTFMFQSRMYSFSVKNPKKTTLQYQWRIIPSSNPRYPPCTPPPTASVGMKGSSSTSSIPAVIDCPFSIVPDRGEISPPDAQTFQVRFAPLEVDEFYYELQCEFNHLLPEEKKPLRIALHGRSIRPVCHIDVPPSDYAQRREADLVGPTGNLGPLDPTTRIIEMESLGIRVRNTKRFYVINPTNVSYEFTWTAIGAANASFRCITPKGTMMAGKRCEMIFEFTSQAVKLQEAFYVFQIAQFNVKEMFLLVGTTKEPTVFLDRGSVNFNTLLLGSKTSTTISLVNEEAIPFNFSFDRSSFDFGMDITENMGENRPSSVLRVDPLAGVIPPNGKCAVELFFSPYEEKEYNMNLICNIKRKPARLSLNVKGEGYAIHDQLTVTKASMMDLYDSLQLSENQLNHFDFGMVRVNEKAVKEVVITNAGKFNFEFNWENIGKKNPASSPRKQGSPTNVSRSPIPSLIASNSMISIDPISGTARKGEKVTCRIEFCPITETVLDGTTFLCTIAGSKTYKCCLSGNALPPAVSFSFHSFNFGPCFIAEPGASPQPESTTLRIVNQDSDASISIDCLFEKRPFLNVRCHPSVLGPQEAIEVPITFTAREERNYSELVPFSVNGTTTVNVIVEGEGIYSRIELASISQQSIDFGTLQIGQSIRRVMKLVNRSKRATSFQLLSKSEAEIRQKSDNNLTSSPNGMHLLEEKGISIVPFHEISLQAKESIDFEVHFAPVQRVPPFRQEIYLSSCGLDKKLCELTGCCQGMDVQLESDTISFGSVCLGSRLSKKLVMHNRGDLIAKFKWDTQSFLPDFQITPTEGMIPSGLDKQFYITFSPKRVNDDIRYNAVPCFVEGMDTLALTLTGSCEPQPEGTIHELSFESRVREQTSQHITLKNPTNTPWNLIPQLHGEHWSTQENVAVAANDEAKLEIVYCPLTMTTHKTPADEANPTSEAQDSLDDATADSNHHGSIFFALPDGTALMYNLHGTANEPKVEDTLSLTTPAKQALAIQLPISNWLKESQRFHVQTEKLEVQDSTFIDAASTVDVGPSSMRYYTLKFYAYKEGSNRLRVTLRNLQTNEYLFFEVGISVTEPGIIDTIRLDAPVRQSVKKVITIENPFPATKEITFDEDDEGNANWWTCAHNSIRVKQLSELTGRVEGSFEVEYRPLLIAEGEITETELVISCEELGSYKYRLELSSTPAGTERVLSFKTPLGGLQTQTFRFNSYAREATEYACSVQQPDFFGIPSSVKADPCSNWYGTECMVPISFEPEAIGEIRDRLVVCSDTGGEFVCVLHGESTPPLPQGPYVFTSSQEIAFKNVFSQSKEFTFTSDNKKFVVNAKSASIPAKQSKNVSVKFDGNSSSLEAPVTGKLLISCPSLPELPPWVFYLEVNNGSS